MTATTTTPTTRIPATRVLAATGALLSAVVVLAGNYNVRPGENGGLEEGISTAVLCALVGAVLFGLVVPRLRGSQRTVLVLGVVTVLSLAVFWAGVTPLLAAAALAVAGPVAASRRSTTVVCWVVVAATLLVVVWTLANAHLW
jgi:hypothetical protein